MKKILPVIIAIIVVVALRGYSSLNNYESKAIASAESYVTSQFYNDWDDAAEKLESTVIYSGKDASGNALHLIGVRCYWGGTVTGSYCVYTKLGTFRNATRILPSGYDFFENLGDLKAMFGIVG